ncbi:host-nuclease inhibitor Gam family protein [Bacillus badius]|uniref:Phage protein n=1 Tax=Bacillus badius TaxID=1455 RepID=A0ABR5ASH0_BACBA|nr:host-nuclease inhibitor Gam family protein [Bacillus badius]KIL77697.1 Phage protein [Bacillus badius]MED4718253.1 host-nuclease inhibitor Gam family protein [Bacillus badius]
MKQIEEVVSNLNEQEEQTFQAFIVTTLEEAAEAQRRVSYFKDRQAEIDAITEQQIEPFLKKIEMIKEWGKEAKKEFMEKESYYATTLEQYLRSEVEKQVEAGKKPKKTLALPYGKISLKKQQPEFVKDEEKLFEYAKQSGLIKVKESTDWAEVKKQCQIVNGVMVDENGEVIPGVQVVERPDKFELKLD